MKSIFFISGLFLSSLLFAQKEYVENRPAGIPGYSYTGYILNGRYHGEGTQFLNFKRGYHQGQWKKGLKHGKGVMVQFSGRRISGTWVDNELEGDVVFEYTNTGDFRYMTAINGYATDDYKFVYHNGTILEGTTKRGVLDSTFTYTFKNRSKKVLEFKDGIPADGDGFVKGGFAYYKKFKDGYYSGDWKKDAPHGKGILLGKDVVYQGDWVYGKKEGEGYISYPDDDSYRGSFKNDVRHGKGIHRFQELKSYMEGTFVEDKLEGPVI